MSAHPGANNRAELGVVLDGTLLSAVWRRASSARDTTAQWRTLVVPCDGTPRSIAEALRIVAEQVPAQSVVTFTLQRPLSAARTVTLPKLSRAEIELVLERDWNRYIIAFRRETHVVAVSPSSTSGTWRAAFAPAATLEALEDAARDNCWTVRDVRTTDDALAAAAREAMPAISRVDDAFVVLCGATSATDVAYLKRGMPLAGRQLLTGATSEIVAFARASLSHSGATTPDAARSATIALIGEQARAEALARDLGKEGLRAQYLPLARLASESPAMLLAAATMSQPAHLSLVAPSERTARSARARVATRWLVAATVALAAAGLAIENHRVGEALNEVARQRAELAPRVSEALARRTRLESATDAVSALADYESHASRASSAVAAIALAMPQSSSLSMLQIVGDSVTIEGESDRSADVYAALRAAPTLDAVRLSAPLRQERQADDAPVEHFAFAARLRKDKR